MGERHPKVLTNYYPEVSVRDDLAQRPDIQPEAATEDELLVTVGVEVGGELRPLIINVTDKTLGNGRPITEFFDRYENLHRNDEEKIRRAIRAILRATPSPEGST